MSDTYQVPADTVILTADEDSFRFTRVGEAGEVIGILFRDPTTGPFCLALSEQQARMIVHYLTTLTEGNE